jgi:hypothetical protein
MRAFLVLVIAIALGFVYYRQKHNEAPPPTVAAKPVVTATQPPQLTPAPRGVASEHNWMKRALDRAADVRDQSRAQTKQGQDP